MQMLRNQIIGGSSTSWSGDSFSRRSTTIAHLGGLVTGFVLGKIMVDRPPTSPEERKRANALGWGAALVVVASFVMAGLSAMGS